ncbi:hypothetical protein [Burkholderia cepacia]|uniref:hypothetical protein n=1 Tax=Burkholderia cepacia TaxID=292 RepID=UPI00158F51B8|nr:hypothetical protein [Burkholderia cepacia]
MNLADRDPITLPDSVVSDIREQGKTEITAAAGKAIANRGRRRNRHREHRMTRDERRAIFYRITADKA